VMAEGNPTLDVIFLCDFHLSLVKLPKLQCICS
jgi:hypothetical protein